ncbi:hypothetical protein lerEdw1_010653, partial [Lerista edwardsae]
SARPRALPLRPDEELDGCEPDADPVPSPSPSLPEEEEKQQQQQQQQQQREGGDDLRKVTLALVGRYLREAAALEEEEERRGGGGGGAKVLLRGLWERLGSAAGSAPLAAPQEPEVGRALETLRRVGGGILEKHQLAFQGMLRKMEIKNESDLKTVSEVAKFVFDDGITNWGRITTLITFGAFVAKHLKSIHQEDCINSLAEIITDVLVTDKRDWLVEHDAWVSESQLRFPGQDTASSFSDSVQIEAKPHPKAAIVELLLQAEEGFVKFFHVEDIEGSVRSILMAFAGVAGLGASLAYMIR